MTFALSISRIDPLHGDMHLEQQIKDFVDTFSKNKYTHRNIEGPILDLSASYSPSVTFVVASNPT